MTKGSQSWYVVGAMFAVTFYFSRRERWSAGWDERSEVGQGEGEGEDERMSEYGCWKDEGSRYGGLGMLFGCCSGVDHVLRDEVG